MARLKKLKKKPEPKVPANNHQRKVWRRTTSFDAADKLSSIVALRQALFCTCKKKPELEVPASNHQRRIVKQHSPPNVAMQYKVFAALRQYYF
ncbi:MAG: hypothetical protein V9G63_03620 [Candidatus Competibacter sp.]|nr:hypothetical protein [Candidatus Competibacteraceae bacterium]